MTSRQLSNNYITQSSGHRVVHAPRRVRDICYSARFRRSVDSWSMKWLDSADGTLEEWYTSEYRDFDSLLRRSHAVGHVVLRSHQLQVHFHDAEIVSLFLPIVDGSVFGCHMVNPKTTRSYHNPGTWNRAACTRLSFKMKGRGDRNPTTLPKKQRASDKKQSQPCPSLPPLGTITVRLLRRPTFAIGCEASLERPRMRPQV